MDEDIKLPYKVTINWNYVTYDKKSFACIFKQKRVIYKCDVRPPYDLLHNYMNESKIDYFKVSHFLHSDEEKPHKILKFEDGKFQFSLTFEPGA